MTSNIRIQRVPYEEPHHIHLVFEASNGLASGTLEIYDNASTLSLLASELEVFPENQDHEIRWELGSEVADDRFAHYFLFRVFLTNGRGHSAIHIRLNNNEETPGRIITEFCIPAMPADINRLGALFRDFSKLKTSTLEWSTSSHST